MQIREDCVRDYCGEGDAEANLHGKRKPGEQSLENSGQRRFRNPAQPEARQRDAQLARGKYEADIRACPQGDARKAVASPDHCFEPRTARADE